VLAIRAGRVIVGRFVVIGLGNGIGNRIRILKWQIPDRIGFEVLDLDGGDGRRSRRLAWQSPAAEQCHRSRKARQNPHGRHINPLWAIAIAFIIRVSMPQPSSLWNMAQDDCASIAPL
jgi:hypothetical protein